MTAIRHETGWIPVAGIWTFTALAGLAVALSWIPPALSPVLILWSPIATQCIALLLLRALLKSHVPGFRRLAWQLVMGALMFDLLANLTWIYLKRASIPVNANFADSIQLGFYPIATAAAVLFYKDLGGTFRKWSVWLDIVTLSLGIGATLWLFFLRARLPEVADGSQVICIPLSYAAGNGVLMVAAMLVATRICNWRAERALLMLIAGICIAFVIDLGWINAENRDEFVFGPWFNIFGTCVPYSLLAVAIYFERKRPIGPPREQADAGGRLSFLPILSILLAIALLFGERADLHGVRGAFLIAFVVVGAMVIALRQQGVRYELSSLQRALAMQDAELRLSELVRRSSDLIAVADPQQRLTFVSPASLAILGVAPDTLKAEPAARLLGAKNEGRLHALLNEIAEHRLAHIEMETLVDCADGTNRIVRVVGSDQLANPAIGGIALTVRDVTDQRRLEREVLDIAARERERLSSDIHDGLGQELTGIALLLKSLNVQRESQSGTLQHSVQTIKDHVENTIELARKLANGLSPLQIGHGSLDAVLGELAARVGALFKFRINFRRHPGHAVVSASATEHLYRIVQEALNNAARHSNCGSVDIELSSDEGRLNLVICDDGTGLRGGAEPTAGLGLRMIAHRARMMGGTLQLGRSASGGARVAVSIPVQSQAGTRAQDHLSPATDVC